MRRIQVAAMGVAVLGGLAGGAAWGQPTAVWSYQDLLDGRTPQDYTIRSGHPRLLITPENKAEIIARIHAAPAIWRQAIHAAEHGEGEEKVLACGAIFQLGLVDGFQYALSREEYGRGGVAELRTFDFARHRGRGTGNWGRGLLMAPCGYDWLYDLLDAEQKRDLAERMTALADHPEFVGGFNAPGGAGMLLGLSFHGDGVDDAAAERLVARYWDLWWNPKAKMRNLAALLRYLPGGGNTEGMGGYYARNWPFFRTIAAWKTATGQDYFARLGYFRTAPYWLAHAVVPTPPDQQGRFYPRNFAKYHATSEVMWYPGLNAIAAAATGYLAETDPDGAALARWWCDRHKGYDQAGLVFGLLLGEPRVEAKSPAALDLPKTFVLRELNNVYMRSSWDDLDAACVSFANTRYLVRGSSSNALGLWKNRGALLEYRGNVARHSYWGAAGEWPLNSVVFYHGTTLIRPDHVSGLPPAAAAERIEVGDLTVHTEPGEYDFLRGNCPAAYVAPKEASLDPKITLAQRTLVYLRPAAAAEHGGDRSDFLVLLDRLASERDDLAAHVVFNTIFEPIVAKTWDRPEAGRLVHPGQWAVEDAPCVTLTNTHRYDFGGGCTAQAHARAFLKTLYPANLRTLKIGGPEHFMDGITGTGSQNDSFYRSFRAADPNSQVLAGGYWRFHVVPQQRRRFTILTAIEATDANVPMPHALERIESDTLLGARAGANLVLFSKDGQPLTEAAATVPAGGTVRLLVCDLIPDATYTLTAGEMTWTRSANTAGILWLPQAPLCPGTTLRLAR